MPRHFSYVRDLQLADFITLGNGFCGALSTFYSMKYLANGKDEELLWKAIYLLPAAAAFDWLDGTVARLFNKSSLLGQELDSLADLIAFGLAPAALAFALGLQTTADMAILAFFVCCGISRLARFNTTVALMPKKDGKITHFEGIPMPTSLLLVLLNSWMLSQGMVHQKLPLGTMDLPFIGEIHLFSLLYLAFACAFVSKLLRIRKL